jgi:hypothetical protein
MTAQDATGGPADAAGNVDDSSLPPADAGGGGDGASAPEDGGACVLAAAWAAAASPGCAACQTANCCEQIKACAADSACVAVFACQQMCYAYLWPDGAPIPHSGGIDDQCAGDCITAAPSATQKLFIPQDTCVNTVSCKKACSGG